MTNKSKGRKGRKGLKLLDLSFEGQPTQQSCGFTTHIKNGRSRTAPVNSRPHGGYRGTKCHPPSPYSFNKSADYQSQMQSELDQMVADDQWVHPTSPAWAIDVSNETNHSGESPLFVHQFLTPSRHDNRPEHRGSLHSIHGKQRPLSANDAGRYRPNSTHQYLTTTELKNASQSEIDLRFGKPTRTTLLRARQRVNLAPQNAYDLHRDHVRKAEKIAETRRTLTTSYSMQDLLGFPLEEESLHSFLIGARYNRTNYVDAKTLVTQGVYMPRSNPGGCFVMQRNKHHETDLEPPPAPPESPVDFDSVDIQSSSVEYLPRSPAPPVRRLPSPSPIPPPQRPPSPQTQTAWPEDSREELDICSTHLHTNGGVAKKLGGAMELDGPKEVGVANEVSGAKEVGAVKEEGSIKEVSRVKEVMKSREPSEKESSLGPIRRGMTLDDGLKVKGKGLDSVNMPHSRIRPISARSLPASARSGTPTSLSVIMTGTSYSHSINCADPLDQCLLVNQPIVTPAPRITSPRGRRHEDRKGKVDGGKIPVQTADKCFNVPSINGDIEEEDILLEEGSTDRKVAPSNGALLTEPQVEERGVNGETCAEQTDHHHSNGDSKALVRETVRVASAKSRKSRVRFAPDVLEDVTKVTENIESEPSDPESTNQDNVLFFMTEEKGIQPDNGHDLQGQGHDSQGHSEDAQDYQNNGEDSKGHGENYESQGQDNLDEGHDSQGQVQIEKSSDHIGEIGLYEALKDHNNLEDKQACKEGSTSHVCHEPMEEELVQENGAKIRETKSEDGPGEKCEDRVGEKCEDRVGEKCEDRVGEKSEDGPGEKSEDGVGEKSEDGVGEKSEDRSGEKSEDRAEEQTEDRVGEMSEVRAGEKSEDGPGEKSEDGPGEKSEDGLGEKSKDRAGEQSEDRAGEQSEDGAGEKSENKSEDSSWEKSEDMAGKKSEERAVEKSDAQTDPGSDVTDQPEQEETTEILISVDISAKNVSK